MSQGATGGKGGSAPSGAQFDYAAANAGKPVGGPMSREDFQKQTGAPSFALDDLYNKYSQQQQQQSGFQNAALAQSQSSRPDQTNAFGTSSKWSVGPDGRPVQTSSFGGDLGTGASELEKQISSGWSSPLDNGAAARDKAESAIYGRETSRLDPMWNNRQSALQASLANQGLDPGSEAGQKQMDTFNRGRNDAYTSALQQSIMGGGQEASRQQQMDLTSRLAPEQALQGLQHLTQQGSTGDPAQYLQAAIAQYGGQLQKYGIDQAGKNSTMGGLSNLGGTLGGAALMGG